MMQLLKRIYRKLFRSNKELKNFKKQFELFNQLDQSKRFDLNYKDIYPCLYDNTPNTGFDAHYVFHPAWATRIIKEINPATHIDISSTLHFCTMLSAFIPVDFYDFRPANLNLTGLNSGRADLTNLHFKDNSIESLSCMHTIEHIGLGRYGDPIDPDGDIKAINEIKRVVKVDGSILFVTPVGKPKIAFNAHRIYHPKMILELFDGFKLKQFALITDDNKFVNDASLEEASVQNYGCGCFWLIKEK